MSHYENAISTCVNCRPFVGFGVVVNHATMMDQITDIGVLEKIESKAGSHHFNIFFEMSNYVSKVSKCFLLEPIMRAPTNKSPDTDTYLLKYYANGDKNTSIYHLMPVCSSLKRSSIDCERLLPLIQYYYLNLHQTSEEMIKLIGKFESLKVITGISNI